MLNGRVRAQKLHKRNRKIEKTKFCAIFSGERAETDARADVKHEISFNQPNPVLFFHSLKEDVTVEHSAAGSTILIDPVFFIESALWEHLQANKQSRDGFVFYSIQKH